MSERALAFVRANRGPIIGVVAMVVLGRVELTAT
jgi:hypothetical protein